MLDLEAIKARHKSRVKDFEQHDNRFMTTITLDDIDALLLEVERLRALEQSISRLDKDKLANINSWLEQHGGSRD